MSRLSFMTFRRPFVPGAGALAAFALAAVAVSLAAPASANVRHPSHSAADDVRFVWTSTDTNRHGDSTYISNPATNGHPNALLFVTPNANPNDTLKVHFLKKPLGVWYSASRHKWAIFTEDQSIMPDKESFNVLVVPHSSSTAFAVTATSSNSHGDSTGINKSVTNGHPNAIIQVTQNYDVGGHCGCVVNNDNVGVWYNGSRWLVFQEDGADMTIGASFNVLVGTTGTGGFATVVQSTTSNSAFDALSINNSRTNGNSQAMVFASQNYNPGNAGGTSDTTPVGVWYNNEHNNIFHKHWLVFNENSSTMQPQTAFNLLIFGKP